MKRLNITMDDKSFNLLEGKKNKSETIRDALEIQNLCVSPDKVKNLALIIRSLAVDYKSVKEELREINSKLDYLGRHDQVW